jgi:hypothetical protein
VYCFPCLFTVLLCYLIPSPYVTSTSVLNMAIPVLEISREGYKIRKIFGWKSAVVKWNHCILKIGVVASCQILGIILECKVMLSKKCQYKNVLLNSYSSMKKKIRKIRMIFDVKNWLWKSDFGTFWHLPIH